MTTTASMAQRFWSKVNKDGPVPNHMPHLGPCWLWQASVGTGGYGQFTTSLGKRKNASAPRVAWELSNGAIPPALSALHRCDNRLCVNPAHLFLGTQADNVRDMAAKGRARGSNLRGENGPGAKLAPQDVDCIRKLYATGVFTQRELAKAFGIWQSQVGNIVRREQWSDRP